MGSTIGSLFNFENVEVTISGLEKSTVRMAKSDILVLVDSSLVFPPGTDNEVVNANINLEYTCSNGKCNFNNILQKIQMEQGGELKALGVQQLTKMIVENIDQHPDVFPSAGLGGYIFQSTGKSYMFLKNNSPDLKERKDLRYGFVDVIEVRKKLVIESMRKQETEKNFGWQVTTGVSILALSFVLLRKM